MLKQLDCFGLYDLDTVAHTEVLCHNEAQRLILIYQGGNQARVQNLPFEIVVAEPAPAQTPAP